MLNLPRLQQSTTLLAMDDEYECDLKTPSDYPMKTPSTASSKISTPSNPSNPSNPTPTVFSDECECESSTNSSLSNFFNEKPSEEDAIFKQHGYMKLFKLTDTLQGELYKAQIIDDEKLPQNQGVSGSYVAVKKICKKFTNDKIAERDGNTFIVEENILKEAILLKHLTIDNKFIGNYIVKLIDFFASESHYYLVMEYIDGITLRQFIDISFRYILNGKLSLKSYKKIIRFILWQLTTTIYFLHNVYQCCHLDLCVDNIMIQNVQFIQNKDGSITLPTSTDIKLCDFGVAELFAINSIDSADKSNNFQCNKHNLNIDNEAYHAPKVFNNEYYDARAADMWALGIIFYQCMTGQPLYTPSDMIPYPQKKNGYQALYDGKKGIKQYLKTSGLLKYFKQNSFDLLVGLLKINDEKRLNADECMKHNYFKQYLKQYENRIDDKMKRDNVRLRDLKQRLNDFPYFDQKKQ